MRNLVILLPLLLLGCFNLYEPTEFPEPQTKEGLDHDLAIIRKLLKANGIPEADSVSYEKPLGIIRPGTDPEVPKWERIELFKRGLTTFTVIPEVKTMRYKWILDISENELTKIPSGISSFKHVFLFGNKICNPEDNADKEYLDRSSPPGLGTQNCVL